MLSDRWLKRIGFILLVVVSCLLTVITAPATSKQTDITIIQATSGLPGGQDWDAEFLKENALAGHDLESETPEKETALIEQGRDLFALGQLAAAADVWQQAAVAYEAQGNLLGQATAIHYMALADFNLGYWSQSEQANAESEAILSAMGEPGLQLLGASLNLQGQLLLALGQPEQSIETWQQAAITYASAKDSTGYLGAELNRARALQILGHHSRSQQLLARLIVDINEQSDAARKASGLKLLGTALRSMGELEESQSLLTESLASVQKLAATMPVFSADESATRISLGQTLAAREDIAAALAQYEQAAAIAPQPQLRIEAQLNLLQLLAIDEQLSEKRPEILPLVTAISTQLETLPPGRDRIYATIDFVDSWIQVASSVAATPVKHAEVAQLLANAVRVARDLGDMRAEAFALVELGHLYETTQQWSEAEQLTQQALALAEEINAPDVTAKGQWQLGRVLKQQGQQAGAIAAYTQAVDSLQSLRQSLVSLTPDRQFSYLETVEPVYRELVSLLLDSSTDQAQLKQSQLKQARALIESLQLAEIDNFFHQACLPAASQSIDTIDRTAAVLYPIILPDRLAVIVSQPGQPLFHYETRLPQVEIEATLFDLRRYLNPHFFDTDRLRLSQQIYDWLIRPAEVRLTNTQTLVFVLDGALRNLPMAALHDGQQYLIERYALAFSTGLQLLDPQPLDASSLEAFTGGVSEAQAGFSALPAVDAEINKIAEMLPTTALINQTFTTDRLNRTLHKTPFPIVHLATHGQFSSRLEETFLLAWNGRITIEDLNEILRPRQQSTGQPLSLLVLSACQTATGDRRAALGLAGMALRSGARSTLATLWQVKDDSTAVLMAQFYQALVNSSEEALAESPEMTKAEALRAAQLSLLAQPQYQHPFYWAPFVLVGSWL